MQGEGGWQSVNAKDITSCTRTEKEVHLELPMSYHAVQELRRLVIILELARTYNSVKGEGSW